MRTVFLALLACAAAWPAGCSAAPTGRGVDLTLVFDPTVTTLALAHVTTLHFDASGDEHGTFIATLTSAATRTERVVYRPFFNTRQLTLAVSALDSDGVVLADGSSQSLTVPTNGVIAATITLLPPSVIADAAMDLELDGFMPPPADLETADGTTAPPPPTCTDSLEDGDETGIDCGGSCPLSCIGTACTGPAACATGVCDTVCIPASGPPSWLAGPQLFTGRSFVQAARRPDGTLLVVGGTSNSQFSGALATTELLTGNAFVPGPSLMTARMTHAVTADAMGTIYAICGRDTTNTGLLSMEALESTGGWTSRTASPLGHSGFSAARLDSDRLIITDDGQTSTFSASADTWTTTTIANPTTEREQAATVYLTDDHVYLIGGDDGPTTFANVDEYDGTTNKWTSKSPLPTKRRALGGVLASDGRIYAIGGVDSTNALTIVEAYLPSVDRWTSHVTPLPGPRQAMAVGLGRDQRIYVIGGVDATFTTLSTSVAYGPYATVTPSTASVGSQVTVQVLNLAASASTNVLFDNARVVNATSDTLGSVTATFNVPAMASAGAHSVTVMDVRSQFPVTAILTVD